VTVWLKALGHAAGPLPDAWLEQGRLSSLRRTGFPRRPRMAPGDRLVYYASIWKVAFAVMEVVEEPVTGRSESTRWPWTVDVEPLVVVPLLSNAPPVEAIGVPARSMSQQSHIRLEPHHLERALEAIAGVGR
jgi:hypothetical protein